MTLNRFNLTLTFLTLTHEKMKYLPSILSLAAVVSVSSLSAQIALQDYSSISDGTTISSGNVPNYTQPSGTAGDSIISSSAGYPSGNGLRLLDSGLDVRYNPGNFWLQEDGTGVFSVDFFRSGSISVNQILLHKDSTAGFVLDIGNSAIQLSSGGTNPYSGVTYDSYEVPTSDNTWYTVEIQFDLDSGVASSTTGLVTIFESDTPANILIDGKTITSTGENSALTSLNRVDFRRFGGDDTVYSQYANMQLAAIPEMSESTIIVGLFALGAVAYGRQRKAKKS